MKTYDQVQGELSELRARQREIAGVASPSDSEINELLKIEGRVDVLSELANDLHALEVENARNAVSFDVTAGNSGASFRDMPRNTDFDIRNALAEGSGSGSYLVPQEWHTSVEEYRFQANRLRAAGVQIIKTESTHNIPVLSALATAAVTGENVGYTESDPTIAQVIMSAYKYTLKTAVSEELLADSVYPIDSMLARATGLAFGAAEEKDMLVGNGSSKITGIFNKSADKTLASVSAITTDELVETLFSLAQQYHNGAYWMMNASTALYVAKIKEAVTTSGSTPYWWTNASAGTPATLLGFPVIMNSNIPGIAAAAKVICFGNPSMYVLGERGPLVAKRLVLSEYGDTFAFNQRLDGKPMDAAAFQVVAMKA